MSKIIVNSLATEYKDEGQGPVILMLHGWWRSLSDFDQVTESLKSKFRIIRLDLPGFSGTEMPDQVWNVADYVEFVRSFLEKIEVRPAILLGHSFGGRIIIRGIGGNKLNADKLVLISAAGVKTDGWRNKIFMVLAKIADVVTLLPPLLFARGKLKHKFYKMIGSDYLESGKMKEIFKAVVAEDLLPFARNIQSPTLLLWGESDFVTPLDQANLLHKSIKNSSLKIIRGAGHFSHTEKPNKIVEFIEEFV